MGLLAGENARKRKEIIMSNTPLMPKATAVWLIDNTSLTFDQIARFCRLHPLEVQGIADGEVAVSIKGINPITGGQLTREEIDKAEENSDYDMKVATSAVHVPKPKRRSPKYTPLSRRQDRPNAILWLVRNHPELKDAQIIRLVGTTKQTIQSIRDRSHWNSANLQPMDPVTLGICKQLDLDLEVRKAEKYAPKKEEVPEDQVTLIPAQKSIEEAAESIAETMMVDTPSSSNEEEIDADAVFAKLNALKEKETVNEAEDQ